MLDWTDTVLRIMAVIAIPVAAFGVFFFAFPIFVITYGVAATYGFKGKFACVSVWLLFSPVLVPLSFVVGGILYVYGRWYTEPLPESGHHSPG